MVYKTLIAGTFDNFHVGHQWLLWSAAAKGSEVRIIVARDRTVERIKGSKPKNDETLRLARVKQEIKGFEALNAKLGNPTGDFWRTVEEWGTGHIILGYDQHVKEADILKHFPNMEIERCTAYKPELFKSSKF